MFQSLYGILTLVCCVEVEVIPGCVRQCQMVIEMEYLWFPNLYSGWTEDFYCLMKSIERTGLWLD